MTLNGVAVAEDGSKTVFVSSNTTFTLTAEGFGEDDCRVTVTVTPPPQPPASCDFLNASRTSVPNGGGDVTLTWGTTNATAVTLNGAAVAADGTRSVRVNTNTTYTIRASNVSGTDDCTVSVVVNPPNAPSCDFLNASRTSVPNGGGDVTLTWGTTGATSVKLNGALVDADGTKTVRVNTNTTYTIRATNAAGNDDCVVSVTVAPPVIAACEYLRASPTSLEEGGGTTRLSWDTTNARNVRISGVGAVGADGSRDVDITRTTTFVLTADNLSADEDCRVTVIVEHDQPEPICVLTIDDSSIDEDESTTLRWETRYVDRFEINEGIGSVTPVRAGSERVSPNDDTEYVGRGTGRYGSVVCDVDVNVRPDRDTPSHHHDDDPDITIESDIDKQPLSYVYLSQVPYTGLELGPLGTFFYWLAFSIWTAAAAYLLVFKVYFPMIGRTVRGNGHGGSYGADHGAHTAPHYPPAAPASFVSETRVQAPYPDAAHDLVTAHYSPNVDQLTVEPVRKTATDVRGFAAYASEGTLTIDDIVKGLSRETGYEVAVSAPAAPVAAHYTHEAPAPAAPAMEASRPVSRSTNTFVYAIFAGDQASALETLRSVAREGGNVTAFMTSAVQAVDDAYRARLEGAAADAEIVRVTSNVADEGLERVISALSTAIDASYTNAMTAAKLAVTRAVSALHA